MGSWGYTPTENDDFEDAWMAIAAHGSAEAEKLFRMAGTKRLTFAWAGIGIILALAEADFPITEPAYHAAVDALEKLRDPDFVHSFRDPKAYQAELRKAKAAIGKLREKADY
jgi:hypothetical protein